MGLQSPDEGEVVIPNDKTLGYLPQEIHPQIDKQCRMKPCTAFQEIRELEQKYPRYLP